MCLMSQSLYLNLFENVLPDFKILVKSTSTFIRIKLEVCWKKILQQIHSKDEQKSWRLFSEDLKRVK